jgi:hypothetical protein
MNNMAIKLEIERSEHDPHTEPEWLRLVRQHVNSLKFGTVQITVHDSRVTQVERSEKVRLDASPNVKSKTI